MSERPVVAVVGAGPGDPGALGVRATALLARAGTVVCHPQAAEVVAALVGPGCTVTVALAADEVVQALADGPGPWVWAVPGDCVEHRSSAEVLDALEAGARTYEIVPGVSSTGTRLAATGVVPGPGESLTTAGADGPLPGPPGLVVLDTAVSAVSVVVDRLTTAGWPPDTPVTLAVDAATPGQRCVDTVLAEVEAIAGGLGRPDLFVIVGNRRRRRGWFEQRPLFGWHVLVTRATAQAGSLSGLLAEQGAVPVEVPTIAIAAAADAGSALGAALAGVRDYDWLVCTSPNGARRVLDGLVDARALGGVGVAAIGPGTAAVFQAANIVPDLVPRRYVAEGLLEVFPAPDAGQGRVLLARAAVARDVLPDGLAAMGWQVDVVEAYRTESARPDPATTARVARAQLATFTSSSTVERFVELFGLEAVPPLVVCIGPITADTAHRLGVEVHAVADDHTLDGLVDAACRLARTTPRP